MHTFTQCMALIPWNNLHHECQSPLDDPFIRTSFPLKPQSASSPARATHPSNVQQNWFFEKFDRNSSMASKMKDRKVRAPCALCTIRTDLFWQRRTFNTFQLLCGILCFGTYIEYCLTTTWSHFHASGGGIYCPPPLWHALQDNYGAVLM